MPENKKFAYEGSVWTRCVPKYGITAAQLTEQFGIEPAAAAKAVAGDFTRLPDADDVARLGKWYAMSEIDNAALSAEFEKNADRNVSWSTGIDQMVTNPKMDARSGKSHRAPTEPATSFAGRVGKPKKPAPKSQAAAPSQPAEADPAEKEDGSKLPPMWKFKAMSQHKQFRTIIEVSGKTVPEAAKMLDVGLDTLDRWMESFQKGAPHPVVLATMVRAFEVPEEYASAMKVAKGMKKSATHVKAATDGQSSAKKFYGGEDAHER
jgi:hypothetical protein